jgi:hypothetical protein
LGEGSTDESWDVEGTRLDSTTEGLSWLDSDSWWGSLGLVRKQEFPRKLSKISFPFVGFLCANEPPVAMPRCREEVMSKPMKKMFIDPSSRIDKPGLDAKRRENLAHAAPMDSFSNFSNARMSL